MDTPSPIPPGFSSPKVWRQLVVPPAQIQALTMANPAFSRYLKKGCDRHFNSVSLYGLAVTLEAKEDVSSSRFVLHLTWTVMGRDEELSRQP